MKPFALSLACPELAEGSKGIYQEVLRQAQHERWCFTSSAAVAIAHGAILLTCNTSEFAGLPEWAGDGELV